MTKMSVKEIYKPAAFYKVDSDLTFLLKLSINRSSNLLNAVEGSGWRQIL